MITLVYSEHNKAGSYRFVGACKKGYTVKMQCPGCGTKISLSQYIIDADGIVTPTVRCSVCSFNDVVLLKGYQHELS